MCENAHANNFVSILRTSHGYNCASLIHGGLDIRQTWESALRSCEGRHEFGWCANAIIDELMENNAFMRMEITRDTVNDGSDTRAPESSPSNVHPRVQKWQAAIEDLKWRLQTKKRRRT